MARTGAADHVLARRLDELVGGRRRHRRRRITTLDARHLDITFNEMMNRWLRSLAFQAIGFVSTAAAHCRLSCCRASVRPGPVLEALVARRAQVPCVDRLVRVAGGRTEMFIAKLLIATGARRPGRRRGADPERVCVQTLVERGIGEAQDFV